MACILCWDLRTVHNPQAQSLKSEGTRICDCLIRMMFDHDDIWTVHAHYTFIGYGYILGWYFPTVSLHMDSISNSQVKAHDSGEMFGPYGFGLHFPRQTTKARWTIHLFCFLLLALIIKLNAPKNVKWNICCLVSDLTHSLALFFPSHLSLY